MKQRQTTKEINSNVKNTYSSYVHDLTFEDLYGDISQDWEYKAKRLQARRWRKIKQQLA